MWLVIGLAVGIGLAVVFSLANAGGVEESQTPVSFPELDQPEDEDLQGATTQPENPDGVGEVVEGFPDTLVAVTQLTGGNLELLTWPVSGPPRTESLPGFATSQVEFDQSGRMVGMGIPVADSTGVLLSFGTPPRIQPQAADVTGFAWHETEPGALAYTQVIDDQWRLSVVDRFRETTLVTSEIGRDGVVVAWGSWGFAIQDGMQATVLNQSGEIARTFEGRLLDVDADGRIVLFDGDLVMVEPGGERRQLDGDIDLIGGLEMALISPDGTKLAVVGGAGHMIIPLDGEGDVTHAPVTSGFPQMAWSSDSRFVVSPWIRGVLIIDTQRSAQPVAELTTHTLVAVAAVPLGQS